MAEASWFSPGLQAALLGMLMAGVLMLQHWFTRRGLLLSQANLATTLDNLRQEAVIAAEQRTQITRDLESAAAGRAQIAHDLATAKETDKVQAQKVEKIEGLAVQTHELVNSQRSEMKAEMALQKTELDKVIAQLRNDLLLSQTLGGQRVGHPLAVAVLAPLTSGSVPAVEGEGAGSGLPTVTIPAITVTVDEPTPPDAPRHPPQE